MNTREKFLIVVLGAVVILMGGFKLLIEPKIKKLSKTQTELIQVQNDKKLAQNNVNTAETIAKQNDTLLKKIEEGSVSFFPKLENDKIQIFFQGLAEKVGISYNSIAMTKRAVSNIAFQTVPDTDISYPAKDAAEQIAGLDKNSSTSSSSSAASSASSAVNDKELVEMMVVSLQFEGSYEQGVRLLDEMKNTERVLRISSFNMSSKDNVLVINISVECYGIVKLDDSDGLSKDTLASASGKANPFQ